MGRFLDAPSSLAPGTGEDTRRARREPTNFSWHFVVSDAMNTVELGDAELALALQQQLDLEAEEEAGAAWALTAAAAIAAEEVEAEAAIAAAREAKRVADNADAAELAAVLAAVAAEEDENTTLSDRAEAAELLAAEEDAVAIAAAVAAMDLPGDSHAAVTIEHGSELEDTGSIFQAHLAFVSSEADAMRALDAITASMIGFNHHSPAAPTQPLR